MIGVLVALKASALNSNLLDSDRENDRNNERSRFLPQSARKVFRPESPKVPGAGLAKAAGLIGFSLFGMYPGPAA